MKTMVIFFIALLMGTSIPALAAVSNDKSASYVRDAEEYLKKGDIKAAIIQLKNAIRAEPKNPDSRVALADLYLQTRNVPSAEKEYLRAIDLGMEPSKIIINLSKTRLLQRQYQKILDTLHEEDVAGDKKGEAYLIIGTAHQGLNDLDKALEYYEKGESLQGKNDKLGIAIAQIYYFRKDMGKAEKKTDEVLALNPKNVKGLILKGELVNQELGPEKSLAFFEQALEYEPENISALFKVAAIFFDLKRSDEALEKLDIIFSVMPNHPLANYLSAVIYAQRNDMDKAEEYLNSSGQALDNFPGALILRGVMNYSRQNYAQATYFLNKLVKITPGNIVARRLLGAALLRQNEAEQAVAILMPIVAEGSAGSVVYALLGSANMKLGNFEEGTAFFEKAVEIKPGENKLKTQLALSKLAAGDPGAAQANLQEILDKDPNAKQAAVFMTLISLREKNFDAAIAGADTLIRQSADNPIGFNLKGAAYMGLGKTEEAREQFEKALEVSPSYHSALMNLAQLELKAGNEDQAFKIYQDILKKDKKHAGALLALARAYKKKENFTSAEEHYRRASEAMPNNIRTRIEFSEFFLLQKKLDRAKAVVQQIITDFPDQAAGYEASGNIDLIMNDVTSAVVNFERMAAILGNNADAYRILGRTQLRTGDLSAARKTFIKALLMADNKVSLLINLAGLESSDKNFDKSQQYIDQLKEISAESPAAYILEGRLLALQGKDTSSLASYLKASDMGARGSRFTIDFAQAYIKAGQADKAMSLMHVWLEENTDDIAVRHILAGHYLQNDDYGKSIEQYELILAQNAKNPIALNNIAWLYSQTGQNKKALTAAEEAYGLFPEEASFIDTYAWILVQQGQNEKGLELLRKAVSKAPEMVEVRYHLAVALNNAGRTSAARRELETIVASGSNFGDMKVAKNLLRKLSE
ncbi:MAG: PEP-CTERM system TPR-repeat protein PrsT [Alphaproteobacteria bacterium]|nr:MAG: PEP-CTERM system TPR-repeat protein PrsT [Alphaproteobacteria bacterium]